MDSYTVKCRCIIQRLVCYCLDTGVQRQDRGMSSRHVSLPLFAGFTEQRSAERLRHSLPICPTPFSSEKHDIRHVGPCGMHAALGMRSGVPVRRFSVRRDSSYELFFKTSRSDNSKGREITPNYRPSENQR